MNIDSSNKQNGFVELQAIKPATTASATKLETTAQEESVRLTISDLAYAKLAAENEDGSDSESLQPPVVTPLNGGGTEPPIKEANKHRL